MKLTLNVSLAGKTAVITGAGGVICGCMAKVLAEAGANVAVLDINETAAKKVAEEITAAGGTALAVGCDVLSAESLKEAHELVARTYGPCRILVNGAGGNNPQRPESFLILLSLAVKKPFSILIKRAGSLSSI